MCGLGGKGVAPLRTRLPEHVWLILNGLVLHWHKLGSEVPTDRQCYPGTGERREKAQAEVPEPQKICQLHFQRWETSLASCGS